MKFTRPGQLATSRLNEFEGNIVALRWLEDTTIPTTIEGEEQDSPAVRADMVAIIGTDAQHVGQQLVFQQVLMRTLQQAEPGSYVVGRLTRRPSSTYSDRDYFVIEDLDEKEYTWATEQFAALAG